jgi:hypothetical protein
MGTNDKRIIHEWFCEPANIKGLPPGLAKKNSSRRDFKNIWREMASCLRVYKKEFNLCPQLLRRD